MPTRFTVPEPLALHAAVQSAATLEVDVLLAIAPPQGEVWPASLQALDEALDGDLRALAESGSASTPHLVASRGRVAARRVMLARAAEALDGDAMRTLGARLGRAVTGYEAGTLGLVATVDEDALLALVEGVTLGVVQTVNLARDLARRTDVESIHVVVEEARTEQVQEALRRLAVLASARAWTRSLVDAPPNLVTPIVLAESAAAAGRDVGMTVHVHDEGWMEEHGMGALLGVAQGSSNPPRLVVLEHDPGVEGAPTLALVGKGVTFDSGGLSLKERTAMPAMKGDMAGAAGVLGAAIAIAQLGLPVRLVAIAACVENMPDGAAYRPADVIHASDGTAIEIVSTDAEGRLALADALLHAATFEPDVTVDVATLTGGAITALGKGFAAAGFTNDEAALDGMVQAGLETGERVWPMPIYEGYLDQISSRVADLKNGGVRDGSAGIAAVFLRRFAPEHWVHLDIATIGFVEEARGAWAPGATGFGVGLLTRFAEVLAKRRA